MNRLYRSARDKKLFGVCGGIAEATGIDSTLIRIVLVITTFFSGGAPIPIYLIAAMVMPTPEPLPTMLAPGSPTIDTPCDMMKCPACSPAASTIVSPS